MSNPNTVATLQQLYLAEKVSPSHFVSLCLNRLSSSISPSGFLVIDGS